VFYIWWKKKFGIPAQPKSDGSGRAGWFEQTSMEQLREMSVDFENPIAALDSLDDAMSEIILSDEDE
jgi:hypothetical protein